jgi:hypothetical protein
MWRYLSMGAAAVMLAANVTTAAVDEALAPRPVVQVALLLDTSNSMDGLIDQARAQLWKIVNELGSARHGGVAPQLRVALYEYGNDRLPAGEGHMRQVLGFTADLDKVSEELFKLRTDGGQEYCGAAIASATRGLSWSTGPNDLKLIFIAGNEPFTQGEVDYKIACRDAITRGIVVNTIFCGSYEEGLRTDWKSGATLADGSYTHIDQDRRVVHVPAPQDDEIARLNTELNETYIPIGAEGARGRANQIAQDQNARKLSSSSYVYRSAAKAGSNYRNDWDLVDALADKKVKLANVKEADLPANMRDMSIEQRQQYVEQQARKRAEIQKKIASLSADRTTYLAQQQKKTAAGEAQPLTLDEAMIQTVRTQAQSKGYQFESKSN